MNSTIQTELLRNYGLRENPFNVTPDPRFLYESRTHREALASLITGIECGTGFQALIAPPGMGKTTLLFNVLERFHDSARTAFLFQTQCTSREFLQYLLFELGVEPGDRDLVRMHEALNQVLTEEGLARRRVIVVIDEAQNLDNSVLETVRLLSDFETRREKLMQIIISGQPELAKKLAGSDLEQLHQRLQVITRLSPLNEEEINEYVAHRLKKSGYEGLQLFTPEALRLVARHSRGIPRKVNTLCFNALLLAFARESTLIDAYMMDEVIADLQLRGETPPAAAPVAMPSVRLSPTLPFVNSAGGHSDRRASAQQTETPTARAPRTGTNGSTHGSNSSQGGKTRVATAPAAPQPATRGSSAPAAVAAPRPQAAPRTQPPRPAANANRAPQAMPSLVSRASHGRLSPRSSWSGPIFAAVICVVLLGALSYFYQRTDHGSQRTSQNSAAVQAKPTPAERSAVPSAQNQAAASSANPQASAPAHSPLTDLTVPPENLPGSSAPAASNNNGQPAPELPSIKEPATTAAESASAPDRQGSNERQPARPTAQRASRAAGRPNAQRPEEPGPEVVTRNFGSSGPSPSPSSQPGNSAPAARPASPPPSVSSLPNNSGAAAPAEIAGQPSLAAPAPAPANSAPAPAVPENVSLPERAARARLVYKVAPESPRDGTGSGSSVVLQAVVGKDGAVRDLQLVSGSPRLAEAAMDAASRWQFQPYQVNGQPVEFTTQLHVDFNSQ